MQRWITWRLKPPTVTVLTKISYPLNCVPVRLSQASVTGNCVFFPLCCYANTEVFCTFRIVFNFHPLASVPGYTPPHLLFISGAFIYTILLLNSKPYKKKGSCSRRKWVIKQRTWSIPYISKSTCLPCMTTQQSSLIHWTGTG